MKDQRWKHIVVEGRKEEDERVLDDGMRNGEGWKGIYRGMSAQIVTTLNAQSKKRVQRGLPAYKIGKNL